VKAAGSYNLCYHAIGAGDSVEQLGITLNMQTPTTANIITAIIPISIRTGVVTLRGLWWQMT